MTPILQASPKSAGGQGSLGATLVHLTSRTLRTVTRGLGRSPARALIAAALLVAVAVLPAAAGQGPSGLTAPSVSPTSGTTATTITFAVTYHSSKDAAPEYVQVVVGSKTYQMERTAGTETWKNGVRYTTAIRLPAGTWAVRFEAKSGNFNSSVAGDTVTITPAPTPKPTPAPTPKPTPAPTAKPTPAPTSRPESPAPTSAPVATASPSPTAPAATAPPIIPHGAVVDVEPGAGPDTPTPAPTPAPDASPSPSPDPVTAGIPGGSGTSGSGSGDTAGSGPDGSGPGGGSGSIPNAFGGSSSLSATVLRSLPMVVVTTGGVTMLMAFMMFGKRRRDGEPNGSDDELSEAARRGYGMGGHSGLVPQAAGATAALKAMIVSAPTVETDEHLPRWRRPSLMEARKNDPLRSVSTTVRLTFDGEAGDAVSGLERRLIRYRLVSLLDMPDEVRGVEIDVLDEGDEVVLLEKRGTYWRVLCPDGREGWLHKMTLGDVVIDSSVSGSGSWTSGDEDAASGGFEDVLRAYDEHRRQFGDA